MTHITVCDRCGHNLISDKNRVEVNVETSSETKRYDFHAKCWREIHRGFKLADSADVKLEPHER